ncbi:AAA family ATPase [Deinococcus apachensis]|uniref:AAA family ATPase n=1 Tax=Deinococcus apachensis TaxID=309886 RepID=UPI0003630C4F|nr:AAA family ATPase [Deinococcus apachensis]
MPLKEIDLTLPLERIDFLVPDLVPFGYVTFLGAREGVGKTTLLTGLAWQMTRPDGRGDFLGRAVQAGPVIYLNTDAADGQSRPVRYWLEQHRETYPDGDLRGVRVLESTGTGLSPEELGDLLNLARESGARCVIVDSFMSTFPGIDGNKLDQALRPMLALRDFAAQTGAAVIVTDHLPKKGPGEKEGERGIMGSTGKSAQARAVHLLTRVQPDTVQGRDVLRWEVRKASFSRSGYAFGVQVSRTEDDEGHAVAVHLEPCDLPDDDAQDTRGGRATAAVIAHLQGSGSVVVPHAELVALAIERGNLRERAAQDAVRRALGLMWDRLEEVKEAKRGAPKAYRLKAAFDMDCQTATNSLAAV